MRTVALPGRSRTWPSPPKRVLGLAGDERLVDQVRKGNESAFEVAYERYGASILSFCRHMLGSQEEAEDAVQQVFVSAYRGLLRDDREVRLKPWLYTIARNRCLSMLRARRPEESDQDLELPTAGLQEEVERRAEVRELLADLPDLPADQRAALLLSELGDLSHSEIAGVLEVKPAKVKALVFRARTGLIQRRQARETPCQDVREQLATLRGGALRRSELRHHLRSCAGCREYRDEVKHQRQLLAAILPVMPSLGLKSSILGGLTVGGGGGGAAGAATAGLGAGGAAAAAKLAAAGTIAIGGLAVGGAVLESGKPDGPPAASATEEPAGEPVGGPQGGVAGAGQRRSARPAASEEAGELAGGAPALRLARGLRGASPPRGPGRGLARGRRRGPSAEAGTPEGLGRGRPEVSPPVRRGPSATPPGAGNAPKRPSLPPKAQGSPGK